MFSWHGWMHHMFDETPDEYKFSKNKEIAQLSHANQIINSHLYTPPEGAVQQEQQHNLSQYRARGYGVGSLMTEAGEQDKYYKQPGHPLSELADKGGRYTVRVAMFLSACIFTHFVQCLFSEQRPKGTTEFDPNNPKYLSDLEKVDRTNEAREQ